MRWRTARRDWESRRCASVRDRGSRPSLKRFNGSRKDAKAQRRKEEKEKEEELSCKSGGRAFFSFRLCALASLREPLMTENEIARVIFDAAFKVHTTLGPGLLSSVYAAA